MRNICDIQYGSDATRALDIHLPDAPRATYVFIHGGGLTGGDKADDKALFERLAAQGVATVSVNYRLIPAARFPEFIEDCAQALAWVRGNLAHYGLDGRIVLGGSSAGAYISMMLAFDRRYLAAQGIAPEDMRGFIFDAGQPTTHFELLRQRGMDEKRLIVDETAPLYHICDARPGRPLLIITAENDMPARVEQNALMRRVLLNYGYPEALIEQHMMKGYGHCGYCGDVKPDGSFAYGDICADFILRVCG